MSEPWSADRRPSLIGRLARLGFTDTTRAQRLLADSEADVGDTLIDALGGTADPDLALIGQAFGFATTRIRSRAELGARVNGAPIAQADN